MTLEQMDTVVSKDEAGTCAYMQHVTLVISQLKHSRRDVNQVARSVFLQS